MHRTELHSVTSHLEGDHAGEWTLDDLQMPTDSYTTDPSSDVLIVCEDQSNTHSRYMVFHI